MKKKVILICDPGIDGAFAVALALLDPDLEVLALAATAGNVSAEQATKNIHILIDQLDPPRWPRLGAAPIIRYDQDGARLHGVGGFGNANFPCAPLHHLQSSEKLVGEVVKQHPGEVTVICLGPLTVLARAFDIFPETPTLVRRLICLGGTWREPGNAGPVSEFHFMCDPLAARQVVRSGAPLTLISLDVMRQVLFSPTDLLGLPSDGSKASRFLRQIVPFGIAATSSFYGIEGFHLKDVLGVAAVALPEAVPTKPVRVDVEVRGELTKGMSVLDQRTDARGAANVDWALSADGTEIRRYLWRLLYQS